MLRREDRLADGQMNGLMQYSGAWSLYILYLHLGLNDAHLF